MELMSGGAALVSGCCCSNKVLRGCFAVVIAAVAAAVSSQLLLPSVVVVVPATASWPFSSSAAHNHNNGDKKPKCVVFNFGDSNSDTGNLVAGAGFRLHGPVGRRFFGKPSGRFSDGRLYIDFLCERLGLGHLSPYLESSGVSFRHGANFAVAGATTGGGTTAFINLATQVRQFRHFKARTAELRHVSGSGISTQEFEDAVYTFDIGQNDLQAAFAAGLSYDRILEESIPAIVARINNAVTMVHEAGGRRLVLHNTGPLGCLPSMLARRRRGGSSELDRAGCLVELNGVARAFNAQLGRLCRDLRAKLANATVVCVDMYAIKYGLVANHTSHGFSEPLMACCGSGGPPYNYRPGKACGSPRVKKACADGDRRISWDGLHYTEAANRVVAHQILSAEYSDPPLRLQTLCASPS